MNRQIELCLRPVLFSDELESVGRENVGLCEVSNLHPLPTIMFKNVLRTFEAEILKLFKNSVSSHKLDILIKGYTFKNMIKLSNIFTPDTMALNFWQTTNHLGSVHKLREGE